MADVTLRIAIQGDSAGAKIIREELERLAPALAAVADRMKPAFDAAKQASTDAAKAAGSAAPQIAAMGNAAKESGDKAQSARGPWDGFLGGFAKLGLAAQGFSVLTSAAKGFFGSLVAGNSEFETYETQLGVLLKGTDSFAVGTARAKERIGELAAFAAATPFELPAIVRAEKQIESFGLSGQNAILKTGQSHAELRTILGDTAAMTGQQFDVIAGYIGKFASGSTGEALMRMQELGIVTKQQLAGMGVEFSKAGAIVSPLNEATAAVVLAMKQRFGGGMGQLSATFEGQMGTLQDNLAAAKRALAEPIFDALKDGLAGANEFLSSGGFQDGLKSLASVLSVQVKGGIEFVKGAVSEFVASGGLERLKDAALNVGTGLVIAFDAAKAIGGWLLDHKEVVLGVALAFGGLQIALGLTAAAAWIAAGGIAAAAAPILALGAPLLLLIAGVALLAAAWAGNWGDIQGKTQEAVTAVQGWFAELPKMWADGVAQITQLGSDLSSNISSTWTSIQSSVTGAAVGLWNQVQGLWVKGKTMLDGLGQSLQDKIAETWSNIGLAVSETAGSLWDWLTAAFTSGVAFLLSLHQRMADYFRSIWSWISTTVSNIAASVINWLREKWGWLGGQLANILNLIGSVFQKAWSWILTTVGGIAKRLMDGVLSVFHKGGQFLADIWMKVQDLFERAWNAILSIFKAAASPIINGFIGIFTTLGDIALQGMTGVGSVIASVMDKIAQLIVGFASMLGGAIGGPIVAAVEGFRNTVDGVISGIGAGMSGVFDGIRSFGSKVASFFGDKISGVREDLKGLFGGGAPTLEDLKNVSAGGSGPGASFDAGGGAGVSGLTGGGAGGAAPKPDIVAGQTGHDSRGDFYYDETGKKIYTSGVGVAAQAAREAKAKKPKAGGAGSGAGEEEGPEASVAATMANVANKVSEAVQRGLEAMRALSAADLPDEAKWRPKLDALQAFISAGISKFDELGTGLLAKVGDLKEGQTVLDTAKGKAIAGVSALTAGMLDTVTKTSGFLQSLTKAKWPTPEQVDTAFGIIGSTLIRLRDQAISLAEVFPTGGASDKNDSVARLSLVGQAMGTWADVVGKVASAAVMMGERAKELAAAPAALGSLDTLLTGILQIGARLVAGLQANTPDPEDQKDALDIAAQTGQTASVWVDLAAKLGGAADALRRIPSIDSGAIVPVFDRFLSGLAGIYYVMNTNLGKAIPSRDAQEESLSLTRVLADTLTAMLKPVEVLANMAKNLRNIARIPDGIDQAMGRFWGAVSSIFYSMLVGKTADGRSYNLLADIEATAGQFGLVGLLGSTLSALMDTVQKTAAAMGSLSDLKAVPDGALDRVQQVMGTVAGIFYAMLVGETPDGKKYNLLADVKATAEQFSVVQILVRVLADAVSLVGQVAGLGKLLAESEPASEGAVQTALSNADMVLRSVSEWATRWRDGLDKAGLWVEDVQERLKDYGAAVREAAGIADAGAKISIADIKPIDPAMVEQAISNADVTLRIVRTWADRWKLALVTGGEKVADVLDSLKNYAAAVKEAAGVADSGAKLSIAEIKPIDPAAVLQAISNGDQVLAMVKVWAEAWTRGLADAKVKVEEVLASLKDYGAAVKEAVGAADSAAKFSIGEVRPLDPKMLQVALENTSVVMAAVRTFAQRWKLLISVLRSEDTTAAKLAAEALEVETYSKAAKSALDVVTGGAALLIGTVVPVDPGRVRAVLDNAGIVLSVVSETARRWVEDIRAGGRDLEAVAKENDAYQKSAGGAIDLVAKVAKLVDDLTQPRISKALAKGEKLLAPATIAATLGRVRETLVLIAGELALAFDEIQQGEDRLPKIDAVSKVLGPAADAVSKALDALSMDKLLKNPLVDTKLRSGWMTEVTRRRLDALAAQIVAGVRRTAQALIDGLKGMVVPEGLGAGLDRVVSVYERLATILERINALTTPDPAKIREIAAAAALLIALMPAGSGGPVGGPGGTLPRMPVAGPGIGQAPVGSAPALPPGVTPAPFSKVPKVAVPVVTADTAEIKTLSLTIQNIVDGQVVSTHERSVSGKAAKTRDKRTQPGAS